MKEVWCVQRCCQCSPPVRLNSLSFSLWLLRKTSFCPLTLFPWTPQTSPMTYLMLSAVFSMSFMTSLRTRMAQVFVYLLYIFLCRQTQPWVPEALILTIHFCFAVSRSSKVAICSWLGQSRAQAGVLFKEKWAGWGMVSFVWPIRNQLSFNGINEVWNLSLIFYFTRLGLHNNR